MQHVSKALSALVGPDAEPLSDDACAAIREGLSLSSLWGSVPNLTGDLTTAEYLDGLRRVQEGPQDDDGEWEPPLGWPGVEPVL